MEIVLFNKVGVSICDGSFYFTLAWLGKTRIRGILLDRYGWQYGNSERASLQY